MSVDSIELSNNPIADAIDAAEEVRDPLDGLAERTATDPGAPFGAAALEALAALRNNDRAAFERLRVDLKKGGCRVTALDEAISAENGNKRGRGPTQAEILIDLAKAAELFHTDDGIAFADLEINGHRETWPIRGTTFRGWLGRRFFEETEGAPNSEALQSALNVIEAKAQFDGAQQPVHIRVGAMEGRLYLDLCDEAWRGVEIDATGWRVIDNPPIRFRRSRSMKPIATPARGGSIKALRPFLNVQSDDDFVLAVAWTLSCFRERGPYPVMALSGEQGSAKSTFTRVLRELVDPNTAPLRALPSEERDMFVSATNGHLLAFDNLSGLPASISDVLCRLATGGGFAVRQLYSDQDEMVFNAERPIILNGIEDVASRPDLADRAVFLELEPIPEARRRSERELWVAFEEEAPRIMGALLDAVAKGLQMWPSTELPGLPRMADFAVWAAACETAFWPSGTFWSAYRENREEAVEDVIEADPIASGVRRLMTQHMEWKGTATDLLNALAETASDRVTKSKAWPHSAKALGGRLRRVATSLRKIGVELDFGRTGRKRTRTISIISTPIFTERQCAGIQMSASSASSADLIEHLPANGLMTARLRTIPLQADGWSAGYGPIVRPKLLRAKALDNADEADATAGSLSGRKI